MKKPVPANSPCSSVPWTFTTALADLSKTSLTSRLIEVVEGSGARPTKVGKRGITAGRGVAPSAIRDPSRVRVATAKNVSARENGGTAMRTNRENDFGARLESEGG